MSEDEIELLLTQCYAMAEVMFEHFEFSNAKEKKGGVYVESKKT